MVNSDLPPLPDPLVIISTQQRCPSKVHVSILWMFSAVVFIVATLICEHHDNSFAADRSYAQTSFITAMGGNSSLRFTDMTW